MLDLNLLHTFVIVAEAGSMGDAAVARGYSAPAVSQQMSRLENTLGVALLERHSQGVYLTHAGEVLLGHARAVLGSVSELERSMEIVKDPTGGRLRVETFSSAAASLIPAAIVALREQFPKARLQTFDYTQRFDALVNCRVDLVVAHEYDYVPLSIPDSVECVDLGDDPVCVILPPAHRLADRKEIRLNELFDEEWVYYEKPVDPTTFLERIAVKHHFTPNVTSVVSDYQAQIGLVAAGAGISLSTNMTVASLPTPLVAKAKLTEPELRRRILFAYRSGQNGPIMDRMRDAVADQLSLLVSGDHWSF